jgi:2',3'-cyclic-nucleotide 2'-phosphodiesterase (5'-nucleotidase family)
MSLFFAAALTVTAVYALGSSNNPAFSPQQQPEAMNSTEIPTRPLPWGNINFLHTSDSHGWMDGHHNVPSWGGDWGDFVSFTARMRKLAEQKKVDLLVVDTGEFPFCRGRVLVLHLLIQSLLAIMAGDLHNGNGLSDSTDPKGAVSDTIFKTIDYDLLTIGNHEVRSGAEALNIKANISSYYGERYLTSNMDVKTNEQWESIGYRYRSFKTKNGLQIVAFGVTTNDTFQRDAKITKYYSAAEMVGKDWFTKAMNLHADLYVILGHTPTYEPCTSMALGSPLVCLRDHIRSLKSNTPIQVFGGHAHNRNFTCYDEKSSGIESGKYGDTVGWVALNKISSSTWNGSSTRTAAGVRPKKSCNQSQDFFLDRRYLDWNRLTFAYHSVGLDNDTSIVPAKRFDTPKGLETTQTIHKARIKLNLTECLGCATRKYCYNCQDPQDDGNIYKLFKAALADTVVNASRKHNPRIILANEGSIRDHIYKGPFYLGDAYAIVPFPNTFRYIANITFDPLVKHVLKSLKIPYPAPVHEEAVINGETAKNVVDLGEPHLELRKRSVTQQTLLSPFDNEEQEQEQELSPGYTTHDGLGDDGDDIKHSKVIENKRYHKYYYAKSNFPPQQGGGGREDPKFIDLVFISHMEKNVLAALKSIGSNTYGYEDVQNYMPESYNSRYVLPDYIRKVWDKKNCTS